MGRCYLTISGSLCQWLNMLATVRTTLTANQPKDQLHSPTIEFVGLSEKSENCF